MYPSPCKVTWTGEARPHLSAILLQIQEVKVLVQVSLQGHLKLVLVRTGLKQESQVCMTPVRTWVSLVGYSCPGWRQRCGSSQLSAVDPEP